MASGIPKSSHLASILFLVYKNGIKLNNIIKLIFADMKIVCIVDDQFDPNLLQCDLEVKKITNYMAY